MRIEQEVEVKISTCYEATLVSGTPQGLRIDFKEIVCPDPDAPTGACCISGVCSIHTEAECTDLGGTYQGDDTTCSPDPCAPPGPFVLKSRIPAGTGFPDNKAYIEKDFGAEDEVWIEFELAFDSTSLNTFLTNGGCGSGYLATTNSELGSIYLGFFVFSDSGNYWDVEGCDNNDFSSPTPEDSVWHTFEMHFKKSTNADLYIDGSLVGSSTECQGAAVHLLRLGQSSACNDADDDIVYYKNLTVGTTRHGSDVFSDDFSSGDFTNWDTVVNDCTLVSDPY